MTSLAVALCLATASEAPAQDAAGDVLRLEVRVVDQDGKPVPGVEVTVRGGERKRKYNGGLWGRLVLELPEGDYELAFSRSGFYDLVVRDVNIDFPEDPRDRKVWFEPMRVMMLRRLVQEQDLTIVGPRYVDPPPLEISFKPRRAVILGRLAYGIFTLTNAGDEPLLIPLEREFQWTPDTLLMRLQVDLEGSSVAFDEPFVCIPPVGCRELAPGESIEIPVKLYSRRSYSVGRSVWMGWEESGAFDGEVSVYFVFPNAGAVDDVPTYTRSVKVPCRITVEPDRSTGALDPHEAHPDTDRHRPLSTAASEVPARDAATDILRRDVRIFDEYGEPIPGVDVTVRGGGRERTYDGGLWGRRLVLELPEGVYEITFSRNGYYDLVVENVKIEDPRDRKLGFEPMRVMMQSRLILELDLVIVGPHYVDPPPLEISFEPRGPLVQGRPARGVFALTNTGDEPLLIPLGREFQYTPETLLMRLQLDLEESDATYDEPFVCIPPAGCRELAPGESIEIPIDLNSRRSYSAGKSEPTIWEESGAFEGEARVYLVFPQRGEEVATYTRMVKVPCRITVAPER